MKINRLHLLLLILITSAGCTHHLPDFTTQLNSRLPISGKPQAIGEYSLGCLEGAQTFSGKEKGLILSQMKLGRYWGHPDLINLITRAGIEFDKKKKKLIIGDLSQSRGGPTLTGHNSHQTGLDVDIWFKIPQTLMSDDEPSLRTTETEEMKPFSELGADQLSLIQFVAKDPSVERIFINAKFKKKLCEQKIDSEVLHKLRAWWGHDDHIHVRLKCPVDSPLCVSQKPVPTGDGCGEDLNWWFTDEAKAADVDPSWDEKKKEYLGKLKKLPVQCGFYLSNED